LPATSPSRGGFAIATFAILAFVVLSPFGRALKAVRDDETAAEILGKNAFRFKIKSLRHRLRLRGAGGVLWAHYTTFIGPGDFTLTETILVQLIVVMGGKGDFSLGPVVGRLLSSSSFQESVRFLRLPPEWTRPAGPMQQMVFGLLLVHPHDFPPQGIIREKGGTAR
jgi:branched-chain amino acid transport system permease protein